MEKKIVFFDIDGTLIDNETQQFPESAIHAIAALRKSGHLAAICTGRPYGHIDPRVMALSWDGCISGCGLQVRSGSELIYDAAPTGAQCAEIRELVRQCGLAVFYETHDGLILDGDRPLGADGALEVERLRQRGMEILESPDRPDFSFEKFVAYDLGNCNRECFWAAASQHFCLIDRGRGMIEGVLRGNSKSTGIRRLLAHCGMTAQNACAFGDSPNDLPMFSCVAQPVAMGGSPRALTDAAVLTTATVLEDGIAKGLSLLGLTGDGAHL